MSHIKIITVNTSHITYTSAANTAHYRGKCEGVCMVCEAFHVRVATVKTLACIKFHILRLLIHYVDD